MLTDTQKKQLGTQASQGPWTKTLKYNFIQSKFKILLDKILSPETHLVVEEELHP